MAEDIFQHANDLTRIRIEQARLLKANARQSCMFVSAIIIYMGTAIFLSHSLVRALLWALPCFAMIGVTFAYAQLSAQDGIDEGNVQQYLRGHIIITCITGAVWSGFAIYHSDWESYVSLFIAGTIVCTITVGGMLPGSAYRAAFIGLAVFTLLPLAFYWILFAPAPVRLIGLGLILYFFGGLYASAKAELNTRDGIIARTTKSLTDKVVEQNVAIQRAHDEKTRFLAATSHDLAQPLHAQGYFIQALRKMLSGDAQIDLLDKIEGSWRAQGKLIEGLVDITRIDSGAVIPKLRNVDLNQDMSVLLTEFEEAAHAESISISSKLERVAAFTDPVLLTRIVRNILSNAIKFTQQGGRVELKAHQDGDAAVVLVSDNGAGISHTDQQIIFDEYVQLENPLHDREQGMGLGLSIVRRLSKLLEIELILTSAPGSGTSFELRLPLSESPISDPQISPPISDRLKAMPLVVIVDDEKAILEGMSILMADWGCQLICASSGADAITALIETRETPALLVVDKRLSHGESGIKVIELIREEINEAAPAILMTGDVKGFEELSPELDIQLMNKPIDPNEIKRVLQDAITSSDYIKPKV